MSVAKSASESGISLKIRAEELRERLVAIRRSIHACPEYGFQEHETARLICRDVFEAGRARE